MRLVPVALVSCALALAVVPTATAEHDCSYTPLVVFGSDDPPTGLYLTQDCHWDHEDPTVRVSTFAGQDGSDCADVFPVSVGGIEIDPEDAPCVGVPPTPAYVYVPAPTLPRVGVAFCGGGSCNPLELPVAYWQTCQVLQVLRSTVPIAGSAVLCVAGA